MSRRRRGGLLTLILATTVACGDDEPAAESGTGGNSAVGGSGGGSSPLCGTLSFVGTECQSCLEAACCSELAACDNGGSCESWLSCASDCDDPAGCGASCDMQFPDGGEPARALDSCLDASCDFECLGQAAPDAICTSGLSLQGNPSCATCLSFNCCDLYVACAADADCLSCISGDEMSCGLTAVDDDAGLCTVDNCATSCADFL